MDALVCLVAVTPALLARPEAGTPSWYPIAIAALPLVWLAALALNGAYRRRVLGAGAQEFVRVAQSGVLLTAIVVCVAYAAQPAPLPGHPIAAIPAILAATLLTRRLLQRARLRSGQLQRTLLVGSAAATAHMVEVLRSDRRHGMRVLGALVTDDLPQEYRGSAEFAVDVAATVEAMGAQRVAVAPDADVSGPALRRLLWALEGRDVELVVYPGLIEVAPGRISVQAVANSPLLHVSLARFSGPSHVAKAAFDRVAAVLGVLLLAPMMAAIAMAIWLGDKRSPIFRQTRVGRRGQIFTLYKFRTMVPDAEARKCELQTRNETDGLMFKIRQDPRVTEVGSLLRRYSLDELPQLVNVALGHMSLVGPRPPLPEEVEAYEPDVLRRLLVKPGLTGLWQVSGRSDLSWEESVRLDLCYVENWSLGFDLVILGRTVRAVLGRSGAY